MFRVGQRVMCIKRGAWSDGYGDEICPEFEKVYTIRTIEPAQGEIGLRFYEIKNPTRLYQTGTTEYMFWAVYFRPMIKRKTDISVFQRLLDDVNAGKVMGWPLDT